MGEGISQLTESLKAEARRLGFSLIGIAPAVTPLGISHFNHWLESGFAGEMQYLTKRKAAYEHPNHVLENVRSLAIMGLPYDSGVIPTSRPGFGRVSRYAWGNTDYHDLIFDKLDKISAWVANAAPAVKFRGVVDTAPLLEREFAQLAGLGWQGKNTMLINPARGSYFFLAALLLDIELVYDEPHTTDHCGTCTRCLEACPTNAFVAPRVLDARKCISYLTIELRSSISTELRPAMGDWLFGCDVCQEVCPWNRFSAAGDEVVFQPRQTTGLEDLQQLFGLNDEAFRLRFRDTPLWRPKRRGLLRNAAIVLGNQRFEAATPALIRGLNDDEPLVRGASAWALHQISCEVANRALQARELIEADETVLVEIRGGI
jgi:epoxyqueuosine reductase